MTIFELIISFASGATFMWFAKARIQAIVIGGNALAAKLRADAVAIEAKASAIKAKL